MPSVRSCFFLVTINNVCTQRDCKRLFDGQSGTGPPKAEERISFFIGQLEKAPTTGKLHVQTYCVFATRRTMRQVSHTFGTLHPHVDVRRGSHQQAIDYVTKADTRADPGFSFEFGERGDAEVQHINGHRRDLFELHRLMRAGISLKELINMDPPSCYRMFSNIQKIRLLYMPVRTTRSKMYVLYGSSDTGKSRACDILSRAYSAGGGVYYLDSHKWWDGYDGQRCVVIEEFNGWIAFETFKKLGDQYPLKVEIKGNMVEFNSKYIFINSNYKPMEWYKDRMNEDVHKIAFLRRLTCIYYFATRAKIFEINKNTL